MFFADHINYNVIIYMSNCNITRHLGKDKGVIFLWNCSMVHKFMLKLLVLLKAPLLMVVCFMIEMLSIV